MFAGKTCTLLNYERRFNITKTPYIIITHKSDDRYSKNNLTSHDGNSSLKNIINTEKLLNLNLENDIEGIIIDEGQFFVDLEEFCNQYKHKNIIVAGLSGDYKQDPFQNILNLISKSDKIIQLTSICSCCGKDAAFTKRLIESNQRILVGSNDSYQPICGYCLKENQNKLKGYLYF
jgi:thymidine kinase